jgi:hypothetical protein
LTPPGRLPILPRMGFGFYQLYGLLRQQSFRDRRIRFFLDTFKPAATTRILDVGGYAYDWQNVPITSRVTLLNSVYPPGAQATSGRFVSELGDGRNLPYADLSFDIAYSNSVIEHVGTYEDQRRLASEIQRVGRQVFVQTPNRWFFVEPHFLAVFVHYLPWPIAKRVLRFCSLRALVRRGDNVDLDTLANELRFVSFREMKELFPECKIHREKWFGMTKSFIAVRTDPRLSQTRQPRPQ